MGGTRKPIDEDQVRKLASYGCTQKEIADFFGCHDSLISKTYSNAWSLGKGDLNTRLRKWQIRRAAKGSDKMLIHLGQHYLGQNPKIEIKDSQDIQDVQDFLADDDPPKKTKAKPKPKAP